jgi:hypothetical protein
MRTLTVANFCVTCTKPRLVVMDPYDDAMAFWQIRPEKVRRLISL